ncbi:hypothetical protein POSPLADRAFT_1040648 [Postia placenta MAD-698-R-SB12]|uniref:Uncharacterized protein n=1 Tax=Postia placenta MAD-698-R-SB12 TaxID=670580 RepID=A0A1X6MWL1_9APHY|nr:hypothetical protein POSPLADRAFT_1040648 [Postia placenta MAD-698-R-SB12]OSX60593.1 hypothetical protein POSPLADRAFT_1040648 [Postia placenta MAD-698-R-SB12]
MLQQAILSHTLRVFSSFPHRDLSRIQIIHIYSCRGSVPLRPVQRVASGLSGLQPASQPS